MSVIWVGIQLILMSGSVYGTNCGVFNCDVGKYCCVDFFPRCRSEPQDDEHCRLIVGYRGLSFWQIVAICISIVFALSCLCGLFKCWIIKQRKNNSRTNRPTCTISAVPTNQRPMHLPNITNQHLPQPQPTQFTADPPSYSSLGNYQDPATSPPTPQPPAYDKQEKNGVKPPNYNDLYKSSAT